MKTSNEIYNFVMSITQTDKLLLRDSQFSLPDEAYAESLGRRFRNLMFQLGVTYQHDRWDCDNYAWLCAGLAKLDHGLHGRKETELAVGVACIATDTLLHAVVCMVHETNGQMQFKLYESIPEGLLCLNEFKLPVRRYLSVCF